MKVVRSLLVCASLWLMHCSPAVGTDAGSDVGNDTAINDVQSNDDAAVDASSDTSALDAATDVATMDSVTMDTVVADTAMGDVCATDAAVPGLDGGGACGTMEFGLPAAMFTVSPTMFTYTGGAVPAGVYDCVAAARTGTVGVSYRATLVIDAMQRFTMVSQLTTSDPMMPGPVTRRSGMISTAGMMLTRAADCVNGTMMMSNESGFYQVDNDACGAVLLHYGTAALRLTFRRR